MLLDKSDDTVDSNFMYGYNYGYVCMSTYMHIVHCTFTELFNNPTYYTNTLKFHTPAKTKSEQQLNTY